MPDFLPNIPFRMFTGQVEDVNDPLKLGRVRVRAHGYYTLDKTEIPTDSLPWAYVIYNDSSRVFVPTLDEWVVGFFLDGDEAQKPIVYGTLPGVPTDEPTISRWSRNEKVDETDIHSDKQSVTSFDVISEPVSDYAAQYPHNKVIETSSGHLIEIDDTPGAERIHVYHKSGTFTETHADGTRVDRNTNDSFDINLANKNIAVAGDYTVEGQTGAKLTVSKTGFLSYSNKQEDLKTLFDDLITEIVQLQTAGSPANHMTSPTSIAKLEALKLRFALLLE